MDLEHQVHGEYLFAGSSHYSSVSEQPVLEELLQQNSSEEEPQLQRIRR